MKRNYYIVLLIFLIFFVISFITNILGALNPNVITSFNLSLTLSAFLPFAFFIAYGIISIPAGMLVEKYKEKNIMLLAFLIAFLGALLFSTFPNYIVFIASLFMMGAGMAMLQVAINPLLRVSGGEEHFAFNSVLAQLIFGGASFLAPIFLTFLISELDGHNKTFVKTIFANLVPSNLSWTSLYWVFTLIFLLMIAVIFITKFPIVERNEDEISGTWEIHKSLFKQKIVILYFIGIFSYVGTEQGVSYWISKFLYDYHHLDPNTIGALTVGRFWGMMSVGCLIGLGLLKLIDSRKVLTGAVILAMIFLSIALFGSVNLSLIAFPLVGFSLSVMWSIVFSLALNSVNNHHGSFAGILCTAIIGGAVVQLFIGWLGDTFGLRFGMMFIYLTLSYLLFIGLWAKPLIANETINIRDIKFIKKLFNTKTVQG
ncbi:MFS transporter [Stygiobacter electus]|uniref:MFS transporter n=1 Tax=Stygiobacter electus TaxID=3032292 RepID=A0AAE3TD47_9BACT|nr:MFS transporter [Stygiobacter electus]MDF1613063.1 MFS transporter [Stygiobacter electus]